MATGQLPFNADAPLMVLQRSATSEPEPFVALDPALAAAGADASSASCCRRIRTNAIQNARDLLARSRRARHADRARHDASTGGATTLGRTIPRPHWIRVVVIVVALAVVLDAIFFVAPVTRSATSRRSTGDDGAADRFVRWPCCRSRTSPTTRSDDFLSVGLADALVTKLQQIPSLQVRPTSAVLEYRNQKVDTKTASEKLKVDGILEGHFLAAGDLVRVNAAAHRFAHRIQRLGRHDRRQARQICSS